MCSCYTTVYIYYMFIVFTEATYLMTDEPHPGGPHPSCCSAPTHIPGIYLVSRSICTHIFKNNRNIGHISREVSRRYFVLIFLYRCQKRIFNINAYIKCALLS